MAEDSSLDDFLDAGNGESDDPTTDDGDGAGTGESAGDRPAGGDTDAVPPATTTYAWSGAGGACDACGEVVERRWGQDGQLVCPACKEW